MQACIRLKRVAPRWAEEYNGEMISRMPPYTHEVLVTAADEFNRRVEVCDVPACQVENTRIDFKTNTFCAG